MSYYENLFFHDGLANTMTDNINKYGNELIGITRIQAFDLPATCIHVKSYDNIDIQFEDGLVLSGVTAADFLAGRCFDKKRCVYQKYFRMYCRIEEKNDNGCVVMFENGDVYEDVIYEEFICGELGHEEYKRSQREKYKKGQRELVIFFIIVALLCVLALFGVPWILR